MVRHEVAATHGTGCTHSAALAAGLAAGLSLDAAARYAAEVAGEAVAHGFAMLGEGDGPVHVLADYVVSRRRIYAAILAHPFLTGLTDGSLPPEAFACYVLQDALYLQRYGQALAAVGSRAPDSADTAMFARHAAGALEVEQSLHGATALIATSVPQAATSGCSGTWATGWKPGPSDPLLRRPVRPAAS